VSDTSAETSTNSRKRAVAARVKLVISILTTFGYSLVGAALIEPFTKVKALAPLNYLAAVMGLAFLGLAIYLAPRGEADVQL